MKLIALDLDGTLFNNQSQISRENIKAIKEATAAGINVVTGYCRRHGIVECFDYYFLYRRTAESGGQ